MFARTLKNFLDRHNIFYGWVMAFLAFITIFYLSCIEHPSSSYHADDSLFRMGHF